MFPEHVLKRGYPMLPGVATPTDIELAMSLGITTLKFFPAETMGGVAALKALAGPYPDVRFLPTGGITPELLPSYLRLASVFACGGSWMAPRDVSAPIARLLLIISFSAWTSVQTSRFFGRPDNGCR